MNIRFNTILIPVDFSLNTEVAIKKSLILCQGPDATIHLLHVPARSFVGSMGLHISSDHELAQEQVEAKFTALKEFIAGIRQDITVFTWTSIGNSIERTIIEKAQRLRADLIVIGKHSRHCWFPFLNTVAPGEIARLSGIAVLIVKPGAMINSVNITKTIVVPVGAQFPEAKLAIIDMLKRKFRVHIRLVTFVSVGNESAFLPYSMLNAYRYLKNSPISRVSYDVLQGENKAKAILNYCKKVSADVLIVNPGPETKTGWLNTHISDMLPAHSKTQVFAVQSA